MEVFILPIIKKITVQKRNTDRYNVFFDDGKDGQYAFSVSEDILIKYDGYISRQIKQVEHFKKLEKKKLPTNFDYSEISGLRIEATQKLNKMQPLNIGQASRISGVSPADISVILVYLEQLKYLNPDLFFSLNGTVDSEE